MGTFDTVGGEVASCFRSVYWQQDKERALAFDIIFQDECPSGCSGITYVVHMAWSLNVNVVFYTDSYVLAHCE